MLTSFYVRNFRLFEELEIERFGRVNLIVGKNNSGKSALLEAIHIYASNASLEVLVDFADLREELYGPAHDQREPGAYELRHFFHNHELPGIGAEGIVVGPLAPAEARLQVAIEERERKIVRGSDEEKLVEAHPALVLHRDGQSRALLFLHDDLPTRNRLSRMRAGNGHSTPLQFVPAQGLDSDELVMLWDTTSLTSLEDDVIDCLKLIEPRILSLAFVENGVEVPTKRRAWDRTRVPMLRIEDALAPVPLKSLGDGVLRLFQVILHLVNASGGILSVDEIESGLHWSIQPKIWEIIFDLAERLDVQVFATTHSRDCLESFGMAWGTRKEAGSLHRLHHTDGEILAVAYNYEALSDSIETDVEVR